MNRHRLTWTITLASGLGLCLSAQGSVAAAKKHSEITCLADTIAGAVIGGLVGHSIGGGRGREAATALGAAGGTILAKRAGCK